MTERANAYFVNEAAEYLNQLESLLRLPGDPDPDQFLRLASGVRGSAQMADVEAVARVASRLEDSARSLLSRNLPWSEELRELSSATVEDLKLLLRAQNRWGEEEERRVRSVINRWEDVDASGGGSAASIVPIQDLFFDDDGPHIIEPAGETQTPPGEPTEHAVPIQTLLLGGRAALHEALALRPALEQAIAESSKAGSLHDLLDELFDLIRLGAEGEQQEA